MSLRAWLGLSMSRASESLNDGGLYEGYVGSLVWGAFGMKAVCHGPHGKSHLLSFGGCCGSSGRKHMRRQMHQQQDWTPSSVQEVPVKAEPFSSCRLTSQYLGLDGYSVRRNTAHLHDFHIATSE